MPITRFAKNQFTAGEISPQLMGRADLAGYANGARRLRNVLIHPTGGLSRRPGLRHVAPLSGSGRLLPFIFNALQVYLLVLLNRQLDVWHEGERIASLVTPWSLAQLAHINWVQNADTLFITHREVQPQRITRTGPGTWTLTPFSFSAGSDFSNQPFFKFASPAATLTPSASSGRITLTASEPVFASDHVGLTFRIRKRDLIIVSVAGPSSATADVRGSLVDSAASDDFEEQAFSAKRGWPGAVTFHQGRLILAGSRELPNRIWMSRTDEIDNFNLGRGLDDEAIEFALLADAVDDIRAIRGARHLQVFTSDAEWMVAGEPITPAKVLARRQTHIGSPVGRILAPIEIDGATYFASGEGESLYEFLYTDAEQRYDTTDLALLSSHLFGRMVAMAYDKHNRLLFTVLEDGTAPVLTICRTEQVSAWTLLETKGHFRSVAEVGGYVFFITERDGAFALEQLDSDCHTDAARLRTHTTVTPELAGLGHLEGVSLMLRGDGRSLGTARVTNGLVTFPVPVRRAEAGLAFAHEIEPLPPIHGQEGVGTMQPYRLVRAVFRLRKTGALCVDSGIGLHHVPLTPLGTLQLDQASAPFSGDCAVRGFGWSRGTGRPLWRIAQDAPQPFALVAVLTEEKGAE